MKATRLLEKQEKRERRKRRIRGRVQGTAQRPRVVLFRSNKHLSGQVIDDVRGVVLLSASSYEKELVQEKKNTKEASSKIAEALGKRMKEKGFDTVVFDRNGYLYHGVVAAFADGLRSAGIRL